MVVPPGARRWSRALPGILPLLSPAEALEVTRIYSVAGLLERKHLVVSAPPTLARLRSSRRECKYVTRSRTMSFGRAHALGEPSRYVRPRADHRRIPLRRYASPRPGCAAPRRLSADVEPGARR